MHYCYEELLDHTDLSSDEFYTHYKKVHALEIFPLPITNTVTPAEGEEMTDTPPTTQPQSIENQQEAIKQRDLAQTSKALY